MDTTARLDQATFTGRAHASCAAPCQDSAASLILPDGLCALAVCDGCGSLSDSHCAAALWSMACLCALRETPEPMLASAGDIAAAILRRAKLALDALGASAQACLATANIAIVDPQSRHARFLGWGDGCAGICSPAGFGAFCAERAQGTPKYPAYALDETLAERFAALEGNGMRFSAAGTGFGAVFPEQAAFEAAPGLPDWDFTAALDPQAECSVFVASDGLSPALQEHGCECGELFAFKSPEGSFLRRKASKLFKQRPDWLGCDDLSISCALVAPAGPSL